jgi:hypothetical protein
VVVEVKAEWALAGCKTTITFNGVCKGSDYIRIFGIGSIVKGTTLKCSSRVMGTFLMTEGNKLSCTVSRGGRKRRLIEYLLSFPTIHTKANVNYHN